MNSIKELDVVLEDLKLITSKDNWDDDGGVYIPNYRFDYVKNIINKLYKITGIDFKYHVSAGGDGSVHIMIMNATSSNKCFVEISNDNVFKYSLNYKKEYFWSMMPESFYKNIKFFIENDLPNKCCKSLAPNFYCDIRASYWYDHNGGICSFCTKHNYVCGNKLFED